MTINKKALSVLTLVMFVMTISTSTFPGSAFTGIDNGNNLCGSSATTCSRTLSTTQSPYKINVEFCRIIPLNDDTVSHAIIYDNTGFILLEKWIGPGFYDQNSVCHTYLIKVTSPASLVTLKLDLYGTCQDITGSCPGSYIQTQTLSITWISCAALIGYQSSILLNHNFEPQKLTC